MPSVVRFQGGETMGCKFLPQIFNLCRLDLGINFQTKERLQRVGLLLTQKSLMQSPLYHGLHTSKWGIFASVGDPYSPTNPNFA